MKNRFFGILIALVLALTFTAFAEAPATVPELNQDAVESAAPETADTAEDAALQEAMEAYRAARSASRTDALEAELKGYVEAGTMTQEQADLILKQHKDQQALRDGACPNCGYQFQNGGRGGKGGRGNGNRGGQMNGGKGGRMNGNRGGQMNGRGGKGGRMQNGQQPQMDVPQGDAQPQANDDMM